MPGRGVRYQHQQLAGVVDDRPRHRIASELIEAALAKIETVGHQERQAN